MSLWSEVMFQVKYLECLPSVWGDIVVGSTNTPMAAVLRKLHKKDFRCNTIRWLLKICFSSSDEPSEAKMLFLSFATIMVALRISKNWPSNSGYRDVMIADRPSDTSCSSRDTLADLNLPTDEWTVDFARVVRWLYSREESKWGES